MNRNNLLTQQVNFSLSVIFLGSFALFMIVLLLEVSEMENPIANHMATVIVQQGL